jgi:hypothetical protein
MGFRAVLTPDDLKKGELVPENGWYPAEIVDYDESEAGEDAKSPGSTNCNFHFKITGGPASAVGLTAKRLFNETALGFGKNLYATLGFPKDASGGYELSSDLFRQTVGSKLEIYIKRTKSNRGNEYNDVQDFRPLKK